MSDDVQPEPANFGSDFILATNGYSTASRRSIWRRITDGFSDQEWSRVAQYAVNDGSLRRELTRINSIYWSSRVDEWRPTKIDEEVHHLLKQASQLKRRIRELACNKDFYKGVFIDHRRSPSEYGQELDAAIDSLSRLENVLSETHLRLHNASSTPVYGPIIGALNVVDMVASQYEDGGISLSKRKPFGINFLIEYFALVDEQIAESYVAKLAKEHLRKRKRYGGHSGMLDLLEN